MALTFYYGAGSPYAWRIFLALEHKQIDYELHTISFSAKETHTPEFLRMNPRGRVPVIVDDEFVLYESSTIMEYLEERFPKTPPLLPSDLHARAIVRRLVREADSYIGRATETLAQQLFLRPVAERELPIIERAAALLRAELAMFEQHLAGDYLHRELSAADLALYPLLAMIPRYELRKPDLGVSSAIGPKLASWMKRIERLPYFQKTYPAHW